jgi:hypothetical protein
LVVFSVLTWYLTSARAWPVWLPVVPIYCAALILTLWIVALWSSFVRGEANGLVKVALVLLPPVGVFGWAAAGGAVHRIRQLGCAAVVAVLVAAIVVLFYGGIGTAV